MRSTRRRRVCYVPEIRECKRAVEEVLKSETGTVNTTITAIHANPRQYVRRVIKPRWCKIKPSSGRNTSRWSYGGIAREIGVFLVSEIHTYCCKLAQIFSSKHYACNILVPKLPGVIWPRRGWPRTEEICGISLGFSNLRKGWEKEVLLLVRHFLGDSE